MPPTASPISSSRERSGRGVRRLLTGLAFFALIWSLTARLLGPGDLWDQAQPRTIGYTTDMLVNGGMHWLLPTSAGTELATKPPMYNWIAAPAVYVGGYLVPAAHKFPSILALVLCFGGVFALGRRIGGSMGVEVGAVAATAFVSGYTIIKLGTLARPDMVLTLWILGGWICATMVLLDARQRRMVALLFWICVGGAALTKGPVAALLPLYALLAARVLTGSFRSAGRLHWWTGVPVAAAIFGTWVVAVGIAAPAHLYEELWVAEIWGRVTGTGHKGNQGGPIELLTKLPYMPLYFFARFIPWSIIAAFSAVWLLGRDTRLAPRRWRLEGGPARRDWAMAALLFVVLVIGAFTLSTGKRADYLGICYPQAALLVAVWLAGRPVSPGRRGQVAIATTLGAVIACGSATWSLWTADTRHDAAQVESFLATAHDARRNQALPIVLSGVVPADAMARLGLAQAPDDDALAAMAARAETTDGASFHVLAALNSDDGKFFERFQRRHPGLAVHVDASIGDIPEVAGWPRRLVLARIARYEETP